MVIIPAIDLKDGKCVRLRQGRAEDVTIYGYDPAAQARDWREQGAEELHVVDLDVSTVCELEYLYQLVCDGQALSVLCDYFHIGHSL